MGQYKMTNPPRLCAETVDKCNKSRWYNEESRWFYEKRRLTDNAKLNFCKKFSFFSFLEVG